MYLNILKKDLKRKKAMNIILLIFIILSSMFISSSVNNIISVTSALDNYFEMAKVPDYLTLTMNKAGRVDIDGVISKASAIDSYSKEKIIYLSSIDIHVESEDFSALNGTNILQSDKDISMNYFLEDGSVIKTVSKGDIYITARTAEKLGLKIGDKISIEIEGIKCEFRFAGGFKDAAFGSNQMSFTRYIINSDDFENYISDENIDLSYGGDIVYINTSNVEKMLSEITEISDNALFPADKDYIKFTYVFDMIVTGVLLVVSLILIAIAFVVLRFTISFTLSEEFREIGVMKAIGIGNVKIRGIYIVKYLALSIIGAAIGLVLSYPFGKMLISVSETTVIMGGQNPVFINIICSIVVVAVIYIFCYTCTAKVKKMSPIDAIRNGQTGERFRKKSIMSLSKSRLNSTTFLALNDIVSSPKRYGIITFTFFLCLTLMLMLSVSATTLKSESLLPTFGISDFDISVSGQDNVMDFMTDGGREIIEEYLNELEAKLVKNHMPANCIQEMIFSLPVSHGENKKNIFIYQGTGTTMDMYEYTAGMAPQNTDEIAITRISAESLKVDIGDTVTIKTVDGDKKYIITAFFQSMNNMGDGIRLHNDEYINYIQASGAWGTHIKFTDNPTDKEIEERIKKIEELFPEFDKLLTGAEIVEGSTGVAGTINAVKIMVTILTIILTALVTILMERSFIAKEQGEIALMKAIGTSNSRIYAYHTMRFVVVGCLAVIMAEIMVLPMTHLCIDPIFKMMGMELSVDYVINPLEMYVVFPIIILVVTIVSAFLTALYTRKIKASDTANIE